MRRRGMLLLVAGVVAGGCSRDAPVAPPEAEAVDAGAVAQVSAAASAAGPTSEAIEDAVGRLLPALGDRGVALRAPLLRLGANRGDQAAQRELRRLLAQLDATVSEDDRADLDALRLELGIAAK